PEFDATATRAVPFDPVAARAALIAAGWKQTESGWVAKGAEQSVQLTLLSADEASNPIAYGAAEAVAAAWRSIGLRVVHESVIAADLLGNRVEPGDSDSA